MLILLQIKFLFYKKNLPFFVCLVISNIEDNCEVFDNICKKFTTINSPEFRCFTPISAYSIANKIFVFKENSSKTIYYDTNKNEWSEESCEVTKNIRWFSSVKVPCL